MIYCILILSCILQIRGLDLDKIDTRHNEYLREKGITCGVTSDNGASRSASYSHRTLGNSSISSRVINGEPTTNKKEDNPWMAKIYARIDIKNFVGREKFPNLQFKNLSPTPSTGAIITLKSIITCGHCVCNYKEVRNGGENNKQVTCKQNYEAFPLSSANPKYQASNQNIE